MGVSFMKNLFISLSLLGVLLMSAQGAFAWGCGCQKAQNVKPCPCMSRLNPLPYLGIGESPYKYSLNPFKGFKNCNKCMKEECNTCTGAAAPVCPSCTKAFPDKPCNTCEKVVPACPACQNAVIIPIEPACPCNRVNRY